MMYADKILSCGIIISPSFITIDAGVQIILWFCLRNLRGSNISITDGKAL
jgi:hypothetical protein